MLLDGLLMRRLRFRQPRGQVCLLIRQGAQVLGDPLQAGVLLALLLCMLAAEIVLLLPLALNLQ